MLLLQIGLSSSGRLAEWQQLLLPPEGLRGSCRQTRAKPLLLGWPRGCWGQAEAAALPIWELSSSYQRNGAPLP